MSKRVLIVAAHADDEVLGAGGAIARHATAGDDVRVLIMADCRTARPDWRKPPALNAAAIEAAKVLGVSGVLFGERGGMTLDAGPELPLVQIIETELKLARPDVVYTHHAGDLNSDHRAVSHAVMVATRPFGAWTPELVLHFEVPSSTGWETPSAFAPNHFVALPAGILERKLAAMACYAEELRPAPHPRSIEGLRHRAAYWGQQCGVEYAEPFMLMREVVR